jgi:thiol-disulfide isomerase/thioredoxin
MNMRQTIYLLSGAALLIAAVWQLTGSHFGISGTAAAEGPDTGKTLAKPSKTDPISVGASAPRLRLPDLQGKTHDLSEWNGKVRLVNFWASWCAPCQYEIPELIAWQEKYGDRGLQVIGIGIDSTRPLANVARSLGINYPVLVLEPASSFGIMKRWGDPKQIVPYAVVVDGSGRVAHIQRGRFDQEAFDQTVLPLLEPAGG